MQQEGKLTETLKIEDINYVIADIEITDIVKAELSDPLLKFVNTNKIEEIRPTLLLENGIYSSDMKKSFKKYSRQLMLEHVENVSFKKPDRICSETADEHALDAAIKQIEA